MLEAPNITQLDLPFVKEYLKVDYNDDDNLIQTFIIAAKSYIETMLGYKVSDKFPINEIPNELTIACLLLISHWYENRRPQLEGSSVSDEIKFAITALVEAHKEPWKEEGWDNGGIS